MASGAVSYHGPFNDQFRSILIEKWTKTLEDLEIEASEGFSLESTIGEPAKIREWNSMGLPSNSASIGNGILLKRSCSYPFLIDPQLQALNWIKNMEAEAQLKTVKANDEIAVMKKVEACLRLNMPCMIEDASEILPAA